MKDHHIADTHCPSCKAKINGALNTEDTNAPKPGDFVVCIQCATINRFGRELKVKSTTEQELARLGAEDPKALFALFRAVAIVKQANIERAMRN